MGTRFLYGFAMTFAVAGVLALDHILNTSLGFFTLSLVAVCVGVFELDRLLRYRGLAFSPWLLVATVIPVFAYVQFVAAPPEMGAFKALARGGQAYLFSVPAQYRQFMLLIPPFVTLVYCMHALRSPDVPNLTSRLFNNLAAFLYLVYTVAMILWLRRVPNAGPWLLYFLLVSSRFGDVGAYLMGRALGRHKLNRNLSPGKTVEGTIFGLVFSAGGGAAIAYWANAVGTGLRPVFVDGWYGALLGFFVGIAAQSGDLVKSAFKRAAGVKDSGNLVPSFGGVLDIIDNFMLTGPLVLVVLALWPV
jgi:phosphatidate cytidylyltransferase